MGYISGYILAEVKIPEKFCAVEQGDCPFLVAAGECSLGLTVNGCPGPNCPGKGEYALVRIDGREEKC